MRQQIDAVLRDLDAEGGLSARQRALVSAALERHLIPAPKTGHASPDMHAEGLYTVHLATAVHFYGGPAGWAAVFAGGEEFSGGDAATSLDRIAIKAVSEALNATPVGATVDIYTANAAIPELLKRHRLGKVVETPEFRAMLALEAARTVRIHVCAPVLKTERARELATYAAGVAAESQAPVKGPDLERVELARAS